MKKLLFWVIFLLGLFFAIGTIITVLSHTETILDKITLGTIHILLFGIILDLITNPAGWLGVVLLIIALKFKTRIKTKQKEINRTTNCLVRK